MRWYSHGERHSNLHDFDYPIFVCGASRVLSLAYSYSWSEWQYSYFHLISQSIWYSLAWRERVIWFAPKNIARRFQSATICLPSAKCFRCQHACNYDAARKKAHLHIYLKLRTQPVVHMLGSCSPGAICYIFYFHLKCKEYNGQIAKNIKACCIICYKISPWSLKNLN